MAGSATSKGRVSSAKIARSEGQLSKRSLRSTFSKMDSPRRRLGSLSSATRFLHSHRRWLRIIRARVDSAIPTNIRFPSSGIIDFRCCSRAASVACFVFIVRYRHHIFPSAPPPQPRFFSLFLSHPLLLCAQERITGEGRFRICTLIKTTRRA